MIIGIRGIRIIHWDWENCRFRHVSRVPEPEFAYHLKLLCRNLEHLERLYDAILASYIILVT